MVSGAGDNAGSRDLDCDRAMGLLVKVPSGID
jgi:hypothetical protein